MVLIQIDAMLRSQQTLRSIASSLTAKAHLWTVGKVRGPMALNLQRHDLKFH